MNQKDFYMREYWTIAWQSMKNSKTIQERVKKLFNKNWYDFCCKGHLWLPTTGGRWRTASFMLRALVCFGKKLWLTWKKMNWTTFYVFFFLAKWKGERDIILIVSGADGPPLHSTFTQFLRISLLLCPTDRKCFTPPNCQIHHIVSQHENKIWIVCEVPLSTEESVFLFLMGK